MINLFKQDQNSTSNQHAQSKLNSDFDSTNFDTAVRKPRGILKSSPEVSELCQEDFSALLSLTVSELERQLKLLDLDTKHKREQFVNETMEHASSDTLGFINPKLRKIHEDNIRDKLQELAYDRISVGSTTRGDLIEEAYRGRYVFISDVSIKENVYKEKTERYVLNFKEPISLPAIISVKSSKGMFDFKLEAFAPNQSVGKNFDKFKGSAYIIPVFGLSSEWLFSKIFLIGHRP